ELSSNPSFRREKGKGKGKGKRKEKESQQTRLPFIPPTPLSPPKRVCPHYALPWAVGSALLYHHHCQPDPASISCVTTEPFLSPGGGQNARPFDGKGAGGGLQ
ncbi:unnamed protein product, partial [Tuber aestivum]